MLRALVLMAVVGCQSGKVVHTPEDSAPQPQAEPVPADNSLDLVIEPSDAGQSLIDAISGAQQSLHLTMYLMSDFGVEDAIVERADAGLDVRVLLNMNGQPNATSTTPDNQKAFDWFTNHGVDVAWAPTSFTYTHEKALVIDGAELWVMTMNASHSALTDNREYLVRDTAVEDVAEADALFEADWAGESFTPGESRLLISPLNSRPKLIGLIAKAKHSIDVEVEELSDRQLVQSLCSAQASHATVRVLIADNTLSTAQTRSAQNLQGCGVKLYQLSQPYIHAKTLVVDHQSAYVGSVNFTQVSLDDNRELGIIMDDAAMVDAIDTQINDDIAAATPLKLTK